MIPAKSGFHLNLINSSSFITVIILLKSLRFQQHSLCDQENKILGRRFSCIVLLNNQCPSKGCLRGLRYNYLPHRVSQLTMKQPKLKDHSKVAFLFL